MRFRRLALLILSVLLIPLTTLAQTAEKPVPAVTHVVIVSIDGLRPDVALRAEMPALRSLLARGSYSFWARTTDASVTLPSHVSMLTGVKPETHGIHWNDTRSGPEALKIPTLFDRAKSAGLTTALVAGKVKFRLLNKEGAVDTALIPDDDRDNDQVTAERAAELVRTMKPGLLFVHLGEVDGVGHGVGWGTDRQVEVVQKTDARLAMVLAAIDQAGLAGNTVIILSADHGGAGKNHGRDDARSLHIPWIVAGPGIGKNVDLTRYRELHVNTEDTYATACWLLGLEPGEPIDGKPVKQILADYELLTPATPATTRATTQATK